MNKIDAPDVAGIFGPQADHRSIMMIQPFAFLMPVGLLQTFFIPKALYFLVVYPPTLHAQQLTNLTIAILPILLGQPDQCKAQFIIAFFGLRLVLQSAASKADNATGAPS